VEALLDAELGKAALSPADRRLAQELTYGCVRWRATLDWLIARKAPARQTRAVRALLQLGLYQIFWLDRIPDHAAVNETVQLAREGGFAAQAGFVNAVLRACLREKAETRHALEGIKATQPALGWSHPAWLVKRWREQWGPDKTLQLLAWNNTPAATFARVNALRTDTHTLLAQWRTEQVTFQPVQRD